MPAVPPGNCEVSRICPRSPSLLLLKPFPWRTASQLWSLFQTQPHCQHPALGTWALHQSSSIIGMNTVREARGRGPGTGGGCVCEGMVCGALQKVIHRWSSRGALCGFRCVGGISVGLDGRVRERSGWEALRVWPSQAWGPAATGPPPERSLISLEILEILRVPAGESCDDKYQGTRVRRLFSQTPRATTK